MRPICFYLFFMLFYSRMKKRVYVVHGWSGKPDGGWRAWFKKELEARGHEVHLLAMPEPDTPRIETWVPFLMSEIKYFDEHTVLVGHSMGCQAIMRFLEKIPEGMRVGKVILVAWFTERVTGMDTAEEVIIMRPWIETPIDFLKVKRSAREIVAFFSDNDRYIPLENEKAMKEKLGARTIIEHARGHYGDKNSVTEVPTILDAVIRD